MKIYIDNDTKKLLSRIKKLDLLVFDSRHIYGKIKKLVRKSRCIIDKGIDPDLHNLSILPQYFSNINKQYWQRYTPELIKETEQTTPVETVNISRNTEENIKKISNIYQENPADILTEHNLIFPKIEENDYDLIIPSKYGTILEDMEPIEKLRSGSSLNQGVTIIQNETKIHKNEKYGFDQFDRFCLYPDPHLIKYEKLLKTIVERNDDLNRDNKYDTKIPKYNEIIKAHNNWYRIKRTKKHYMILKLMPLVASYEDPQNQLEVFKFLKYLANYPKLSNKDTVSRSFLCYKRHTLFENVSVNLSQEYTDIQTTNSELQEKIYEVVMGFISEYKVVCLSGPIHSYINFTNPNHSNSLSVDVLTDRIKELTINCSEDMGKIISNDLKSAFIYINSIYFYLNFYDIFFDHALPNLDICTHRLIPIIYDSHCMQKILTQDYAILADLFISTCYIHDHFTQNTNLIIKNSNNKVMMDFCRNILTSLIQKWQKKLNGIHSKFEISKKELNSLKMNFNEYIEKKSKLIDLFTSKTNIELFNNNLFLKKM